MKNLMKTNCYDIENEIAIIGSCLPNMQPKAFGVRIDIWTHFMRGCIIDYVY